MSFAPLAGRLAAHAAELRPVEGSRDNLAKFLALVMCALLDMLILVCEMLDARAAAGVCTAASCVSAPSMRRQVSPGTRRTPTLKLVPAVRAIAPIRAEAKSITTVATARSPCLAWSREAGSIRTFSYPWRPFRKTRPLSQVSGTPKSLSYRNINIRRRL